MLASAEHVPSSSEDGTPHGTVGLRTGVQEVLCKGVRGRGQEQGREEMETRVQSGRADVIERGLQFSMFNVF